MRIIGIPEAERPRERCLRLGPAALSACELVALALGGGSARGSALALAMSLLEQFATLRALARAHPAELCRIAGVGSARSAALAAAFELGRRAEQSSPGALAVVNGPEDVAQLLRAPLAGLGQEAVAVLHLGARHQALRVQMVALGGLNAASVEPREVFRGAIAVGAHAIVLAHNHPSGSAEPSDEDVRLTRRLAACAQTLGVELLDHLVIGEASYVSLRERGLF
jgi:DNA repair protein RadC